MIPRTTTPKDRTLDIEGNLAAYVADRQPSARCASWDYCFNHFQAHRDDPARMASTHGLELSCLHLGFYLASWGMFRGRSPLLRRSVKHYAPVVEVIATTPEAMWNVDADGYGSAEVELLFDTASRLRRALPDGASHTLVTKILLGVFGSVPAFDSFKTGFGATTFSRGALVRLAEFHAQHRATIEEHRIPDSIVATSAPGR